MAHISHGYQLGRMRPGPFLAQKWELGWDRPLADWRAEVGLPQEIPPPGQWQPPCTPAPERAPLEPDRAGADDAQAEADS